MKTPLLWIAVFGIYIIVLLWDGIRRVFKNNNAEEYYAAGRGVSNLALLATVAMSIFSGLSYYGYPASIYKFGVGYYGLYDCNYAVEWPNLYAWRHIPTGIE